MLDKSTLEQLKAEAVEQRDRYIQMLHEANGAIGMLDYLLAQIADNSQHKRKDK